MVEIEDQGYPNQSQTPSKTRSVGTGEGIAPPRKNLQKNAPPHSTNGNRWKQPCGYLFHPEITTKRHSFKDWGGVKTQLFLLPHLVQFLWRNDTL